MAEAPPIEYDPEKKKMFKTKLGIAIAEGFEKARTAGPKDTMPKHRYWPDTPLAVAFETSFRVAQGHFGGRDTAGVGKIFAGDPGEEGPEGEAVSMDVEARLKEAERQIAILDGKVNDLGAAVKFLA